MTASPALILSASPLVDTAYGMGFFDEARCELRRPFGCVVLRRPPFMVPATDEQARTYYRGRAATRAELVAWYDKMDAAARNTGD